MDEQLTVDRDGHMQFLAGQMHEDKIAGLHVRAIDRCADPKLFRCRAWHADSGAERGVLDQTAAVEAAGRGAAKTIRLPDHGRRRGNHRLDGGGLPLGRRLKRGGFGRPWNTARRSRARGKQE